MQTPTAHPPGLSPVQRQYPVQAQTALAQVRHRDWAAWAGPTPGLPEFDYVKPASLTEASRFLAEHAGEARPFLGGTDLFIQMRDRAIRPRYLVDVKHADGLGEIRFDEAEGLTIGAAVPMNRVIALPAVGERYPVLAEAARTVGSYQLRTRATIVGNVCNASPAADTVPALLVLEAVAHVFGLEGRRTVPLAEFFVGPGETVLGSGDIVTAVQVPVLPRGYRARYIKLGRNAVGDLAIVGVAAASFPDPAQPSGYAFRVALASVAPTPLRARQAEAILNAGPLNGATIKAAAEAAMGESNPISDVRGSREYRLAMVKVLTRRAVQEVAPR